MKKYLTVFFFLQLIVLASCTTDADDEWNAAEVCPESGRGTFVDERDGQTYKYTTIGNQVWMAQNLNYHVEKGDKCMYEDDDCALKGRLYNIENIFDACPNGWHLPSNEEWMKMLKKMGGIENAGLLLRSKEGWITLDPDENGNGTDDCGFTALPALNPYIEYEGYVATFLAKITYKSSGKTFLWKAEFSSNENAVFTVDAGEGRSFSVRCVKD